MLYKSSFLMSLSVLACIISMPASALSEDEFGALLNEYKTEEKQDAEIASEVEVQEIESAEIFSEIDPDYLELRKLKQQIEIEEAKKRLRELRGGSVQTLGSGDLVALRNELQSIKSMVQVLPADQLPGTAVEVMAEQNRSSANWIVKSISIGGDRRFAIIQNADGQTFRVRERDKLEEVKIISIGPSNVSVSEGGDIFDLPIASLDVTPNATVDSVVSYDNLVEFQPEDRWDSPVYPTVRDSASHY